MPPSAPRDVRCRHAINWKNSPRYRDTSRVSAMPERLWWKRSNCISNSRSRTRRASRAGLRRIRGKTAAAEKGDKAHCPTPSMGNALCPLSVAPRTLSVAPADSAHAHHTPSVWLVSRKKRASLLLLAAACRVLPRALTPRAVAPSLLPLAPSRRAFALSFCRSPSLSAVTTTLRSQLALSLLHSVTTSTAPAAHLGSVRPQGPRIHAR